jgi:hypothetical protein
MEMGVDLGEEVSLWAYIEINMLLIFIHFSYGKSVYFHLFMRKK